MSTVILARASKKIRGVQWEFLRHCCPNEINVLNKKYKSGTLNQIEKEKYTFYIVRPTYYNNIITVFDFFFFLFVELNGIDDGILTKALRVLEKRQQAEILTLDGGSGVKFFA